MFKTVCECHYEEQQHGSTLAATGSGDRGNRLDLNTGWSGLQENRASVQIALQLCYSRRSSGVNGLGTGHEKVSGLNI